MLRLLFVWLFFSAPLMAEELSLRGFYTVGVNWVDSDVDWRSSWHRVWQSSCRVGFEFWRNSFR